MPHQAAAFQPAAFRAVWLSRALLWLPAIGLLLRFGAAYADELILRASTDGFAVGASSNLVQVNLVNEAPLQGLQFHVAYDPSFVRPMSVEGVGRLSQSGRLHHSISTPGVLRVLVYDRRDPTWSLDAGAGPVVAIGFEAVEVPSARAVQLSVVHGLAAGADGSSRALPLASVEVPVVEGRSGGAPESSGDGLAIPAHFGLLQSSPNPFSSTTAIRFDVPRTSLVRIAVYDLAGRLVRELVRGSFDPGRHVVAWDARSQGARARPGLFFYVMEADGFRAVKKIVRLE
jgi:hypothetical protein